MLIRAFLLSLIVLIGHVGHPKADYIHPDGGEAHTIVGTLLCDKKAFIEDILTAQLKSFDAALQKYTEYFHRKNDLGDESCAWLEGGVNYFVYDVFETEIYNIKIPNGKLEEVVIAEVYWIRKMPNEKASKQKGYIFLNLNLIKNVAGEKA